MSVMSSSAAMALGTATSRLTGFFRSALLVAALGAGLRADLFNIANTLPNMLFILLAGGVFNTVLVPQLVRAAQRDDDDGTAFTNRIITVAGIGLIIVSALLTLAAPLVMRIWLDPAYFTAEFAAQRDSVIDLARYCMPQVFFYGMFALLSQVLNARGSFAPAMWTPIANNLIVIAILGGYLIVEGAARGSELCAGFSPGAELVLGLGSTLGIAVQFAMLLPYLRKVGYRFQPQLGLRGSGLGETLRLGSWSVALIVVNQIAYSVVIRLASSGTIPTDGCAGASEGTGYTIYSGAWLLVIVPHSVITLSLATAVLPAMSRLAAAGDLSGLSKAVATTLRATYAIVLPILLFFPIVALDLADLVWGYGAGSDSYRLFAPTLTVFAIAFIFYTAHFQLLRGFYALQQTKQTFYIQCVIGTVNIGAAIALTWETPASQTAPRLAVAFALSYAIGTVVAALVLRRTLGGLGGRDLIRYGIRLAVVAGLAAGCAALAHAGLDSAWPEAGKLAVIARLMVTAAVGGVTYLLLARLFHLAEITETVAQILGRARSLLSQRRD